MASEKSSDNRARIWAAIVYPESAPDNWRQLLDDEHIEWAESPLHDLDVNESNGEVKKPHWHILLAFEGKKTFQQVSEILSPIHSTIPQRCHSIKGAVRYMAHLDNPEKHQYSSRSIIGHGGFDVAAQLVPSSAQRYEMLRDMQAWCWRNNCNEFCDLLEYAAREHFEDWYPLLCDSCAFVMTAYLRSRRYKSLSRPDPEQGDK